MSAHEPIRTIAIVTKRSEPRARPVVERLVAWAVNRGVELIFDSRDRSVPKGVTPVSGAVLGERADLFLVLGGDGTMLATARLVAGRGTPVLGINFGTLGYLTEFTDDDLFPALEEIVHGEYAVDPRVMIDCEVERRGRPVERATALNDVVVTKAALARIVEIDCWIDGRFVTYYRADGLIVSTPTGSTAYNLSAGGPILMPTMGAFVLNPICPHTLSNRPLVVPDSVTIDLKQRPSGEEVMLTIDGQVGVKLAVADRVRVRKSAHTFNVITPRDRNYFEVLRGKLRWGGKIDAPESE
jgi:NAD+ kinase